MKGFLRVGLVGVLAALGLQCGLPDSDYFGKVSDSPDPTHFRFCNSGEPEYVDPALATSTTGTPLARLMFAGLTDFGMDMSGTPVPSIAKSWDISEDLRTFTFHLRDDVTWSNGRPLTSADFIYHVARILHPTTLSRNTTPLEPIKNATAFIAGRVRILQEDAGGFRKGDIVEVVGEKGEVAEDLSKAILPNSNTRTSSHKLYLRDLGAAESDAYAKVPAGEEVEIIELATPDGANEPWAYVFYMGLEWNYGWVPYSQLDGQPNGEAQLTIREIAPEHRLGVSLPPAEGVARKQGTVPGSSLLMLPEALGVRAPDPHTFVIETWSPIPYIIDDTATRTFRPTPRESVARSPLRWTRPKEGLIVTSGPFTLTKWKARDRLEFVKSDTYFDKESVKVDRFTAFSIDDQAASTHLYFQGSCDATASNTVPYSYLPVLNGEKRGGKAYKDFKNEPYDGIYFFTINTEKANNVHLRRALTMAIDRSPIPRILHGGEFPSTQFVPGRDIQSLTDEELALCGVTRDTPGVARIVAKDEYCYVPPQGLAFDPAKAKEELALAKKEMGKDFPKSIDLKFNTGSEGHKVVAEFVQQEWKVNLGLDVALSSMEWKTYLKETSAGNFYIARMGWIGGPPDPEGSFHIVFKCGSPYNRARWCNKEYDALLVKAAQTVDRKERLATLSQAEKILLEEAPLIPMYVYTQKLMRKPYVRDLPVNMGDNPPLHRAWIDPNWKKASTGAKGGSN